MFENFHSKTLFKHQPFKRVPLSYLKSIQIREHLTVKWTLLGKKNFFPKSDSFIHGSHHLRVSHSYLLPFSGWGDCDQDRKASWHLVFLVPSRSISGWVPTGRVPWKRTQAPEHPQLSPWLLPWLLPSHNCNHTSSFPRVGSPSHWRFPRPKSGNLPRWGREHKSSGISLFWSRVGTGGGKELLRHSLGLQFCPHISS